MKKSMLLFAIIFSVAGMLKAQDNQEQQLVNLTVEIQGTTSKNGSINLMVYDSEANWLENEVRIMKIDLTKEDNYTFEVKDLPAGTYAISVIHDANNNGDLDMGMMGPEEAYGFSNNVRGMFGPAPFHKAAMAVNSDTKTTIKLY